MNTDSGGDHEMPKKAPSTATADDLVKGDRYIARVQNVQRYGVFVSLTSAHTTDVSGLVHESELPPLSRPQEYSPGDRLAVSLEEVKDNGDLSFVAHYGEETGGVAGPMPPEGEAPVAEIGSPADDPTPEPTPDEPATASGGGIAADGSGATTDDSGAVTVEGPPEPSTDDAGAEERADLATVEERLDDVLADRLESLGIGGVLSDGGGATDASSFRRSPIADAIKSLWQLQDDGYRVEEARKETKDGTVELTYRLEPAE